MQFFVPLYSDHKQGYHMGHLHGPYKDNQSLEEALNQFRSGDDEVTAFCILNGKMVNLPQKVKKTVTPQIPVTDDAEIIDFSLF